MRIKTSLVNLLFEVQNPDRDRPNPIRWEFEGNDERIYIYTWDDNFFEVGYDLRNFGMRGFGLQYSTTLLPSLELDIKDVPKDIRQTISKRLV